MSNSSPSSYALPTDLVSTLKKMGLVTPVWEREITPEEIQYFLDRWLFVQIISTNNIPPLEQVKILTAKSKWKIINYGDALTSSPGEFLFAAGHMQNENMDEDGDGGQANGGQGTIWRQAFNTATEMVQLAKEFGWEGIHFVDGHPLMKWAVWMEAMDEQVPFTGFEPSEKDLARRERVKRSQIEDAKLLSMRPKQ